MVKTTRVKFREFSGLSVKREERREVEYDLGDDESNAVSSDNLFTRCSSYSAYRVRKKS